LILAVLCDKTPPRSMPLLYRPSPTCCA